MRFEAADSEPDSGFDFDSACRLLLIFVDICLYLVCLVNFATLDPHLHHKAHDYDCYLVYTV